MSAHIPRLFEAMEEPAIVHAHVMDGMAKTQTDAYFDLARDKGERVNDLVRRFHGRRVDRIYIGGTQRNSGFSLPGVDVRWLDRERFVDIATSDIHDIVAEMAGAIVLLTNNDVGRSEHRYGFSRLVSACDDTLFLGWDMDNHHWMEASTLLAGVSDMYFPAHNQNMWLLSRFNWLTAGPVPCATNQWSRKQLSDSLPLMLSTERSDEPLGQHMCYQPFTFRNQVAVTMHLTYDRVGFNSGDFHKRTDDERMFEWISHKAHWIIPALNDVPNRIFDALSTGGIPIVPESLRYIVPVSDIPADHIVFYSPMDIVKPQQVVAAAVAKFDAAGKDGIAARARYALDNHHGEQRIRRILALAQDRFRFQPMC